MGSLKLSHVAGTVLLLLLWASHAFPDERPSFIKGKIISNVYDGQDDDLLTGGLGKTGLQNPTPPGFFDSLNPTAAELRRRAIHTNYRALVDPTPAGGYGVLYGPNIDLNGNNNLGEGKIAGEEHLAFARDGSGNENVVLMVQIPLDNDPPTRNFDPANPCIVTAPSSGSRGIYGAIGTAGDWGLKRGCAVAYTDKGTGTGAHDLQNGKVNLITGKVESAAVAGKNSQFTAKLDPHELAAFNAATPNRFAFKHAHSRQNPEQDWGKHLLQSIEFAFFVLNEKFGDKDDEDDDGKVAHRRITRKNTIVIASSVSNGGGASIRAAELDRWGLIDGVAVAEPNVNPRRGDGDDDDDDGDNDDNGGSFSIVQGSKPPVTNHSKSLLDYTTLVNVFQPCASVSQPTAPLNLAASPNRCTSLREKGLLTKDTLAEQAAEAQAIINNYGILPEQNIVQPSHAFAFVPQSVSVTYANSYGRFSVLQNLCGYSFGATNAAGDPMPLAPHVLEVLFSVSNGIPPTGAIPPLGGVNLINNLSLGGPKEDRVSTSPSTGLQDQNLDGALCLRAFATGVDPVTGERLTGQARRQHVRILSGIHQIRASGRLHGKPAVIVTGRNDAVLAPNHTSRAYYGLNQLMEGTGSQLRYYEVLNAHHLDAFNAFAGFDSRFVPLHVYFSQALNLMYDHLKNGTPLPPSQVVRTIPRGAGPPVPNIMPFNVPPISAAPAAGDLITIDGATPRIPE